MKDRLRVLETERPDNFYQRFNVVPSSLWQELLQAKIVVENWHSLAPVNENYGPKGREEEVRKAARHLCVVFSRILVAQKNILVLNDEAHHCHRPSEEDKEEQKRQRFGLAVLTAFIVRGVLKHMT